MGSGDRVGGSESSLSRVVSVGAVVLVGGTLALFHAVSIVTASGNVWTVLSGGVTSLSFSLAVVAIGVWVGRRWEAPTTVRVAVWCVGGTAAFGVLAVLASVLVESQGGRLPFGPRWFGGASSVGALLGSVLGIYDARQIRARRRWREVKARTERLNTRLRRSNERLMVLNRVLRHNVRNDLNVVVGRAELVADRNDGVDERDARTIVDVAERLVDQSDKARTLETLMETQGEAQPIDLTAVVERELADLGREYPAIAVEAEMPDEQPVAAAPSLDTAVANVLDNAARHNDAEDPWLSVTVAREDDTVELTIVDNGPGIPDHELDVLDAGAETKLEHSSGLGLWTAVWVVEHSDGDIEFADNDPRGTVVTLRFPAAEDAASMEFLDTAGVEGLSPV